VHHLHALLIGGAAFIRNGLETRSDARETSDHVAKIVAGDTHELDVIESGASGRSHAAAKEADFAEIVAARKVG
jgi:hypothetical protein